MGLLVIGAIVGYFTFVWLSQRQAKAPVRTETKIIQGWRKCRQWEKMEKSRSKDLALKLDKFAPLGSQNRREIDVQLMDLNEHKRRFKEYRDELYKGITTPNLDPYDPYVETMVDYALIRVDEIQRTYQVITKLMSPERSHIG